MNATRMKTVAIAIVSLLVAAPVAPVLAEWDEVVFADDFSTDGPLDPAKWVVNQPSEWWWTQGRTFFPSPTYHPDGPFPRVVDGSCQLVHQTYNPYDLAQVNWSFLGGQIRTAEQFPATRAYRFEARVRGENYPEGLVTSFFTYGFDGADSDEIDFEFVSARTDETGLVGATVLTNTWNDSVQSPEWVFIPGLDLTEWNTFRIYWWPRERVDWTWLKDPTDELSEALLRSETDATYIPDEDMGLYSNVWAADAGWPDAYSPDLQPVSYEHLNETVVFGIDDVRVTVPEPCTATLLVVGLPIALCRRRTTRIKEPQ